MWRFMRSRLLSELKTRDNLKRLTEFELLVILFPRQDQTWEKKMERLREHRPADCKSATWNASKTPVCGKEYVA